MKTKHTGWKRRERGRAYVKEQRGLTATVIQRRDETGAGMPCWDYRVYNSVTGAPVAHSHERTLKAAKETVEIFFRVRAAKDRAKDRSSTISPALPAEAPKALQLPALLEDALALLQEPYVDGWDHKRVAFLKRLNRYEE